MTKFDQDRSSLIKLLQVFKKCDGRKEGRKEGGGREGIVSIYDLDIVELQGFQAFIANITQE